MGKLTLDQPATYEIKVPGRLNDRWLAGDERVTVAEIVGHDRPITVLTGEVDQAALLGVLRRLYSLGLPIISVQWIACD